MTSADVIAGHSIRATTRRRLDFMPYIHHPHLVQYANYCFSLEVNMLDESAINARIRKQFPFQILLLGRIVTFRESATQPGRIAIDIEEDFYDVFDKAIQGWDWRRGTVIDGPEERANFKKMKSRLERKETVKQFLSFFVRQPIGPRLLLFDKKKKFKHYIGRQTALNEACFTWDAITKWPRDRSKKVKLSFACAGYRNRLAKHESEPEDILSNSLSFCMCCSNVSDLTGCCGSHKKDGARTLFTYYPFFKKEGFPELDF